jgi:hypothetical protein
MAELCLGCLHLVRCCDEIGGGGSHRPVGCGLTFALMMAILATTGGVALFVVGAGLYYTQRLPRVITNAVLDVLVSGGIVLLLSILLWIIFGCCRAAAARRQERSYQVMSLCNFGCLMQSRSSG